MAREREREGGNVHTWNEVEGAGHRNKPGGLGPQLKNDRAQQPREQAERGKKGTSRSAPGEFTVPFKVHGKGSGGERMRMPWMPGHGEFQDGRPLPRGIGVGVGDGSGPRTRRRVTPPFCVLVTSGKLVNSVNLSFIVYKIRALKILTSWGRGENYKKLSRRPTVSTQGIIRVR